MSYRSKLTSTVLALSILAAGGGAYAAQQSVYHEITEEVSDIRELELLEPLDIDVQSRQELQEWVSEQMGNTSADEQEMYERTLTIFGFIEPGTDTAALESEIYGEQIAGFYDPETKSMVVVRSNDEGGMSANDEVTFAHEAVHALQDQHFDLLEVQGDLESLTDDQYLALTALIEGDATIAQVLYLAEHPLLYLRVEDELADMESPVLDNAPLFFSETLLFPYVQGSSFVLEIYEDGGWDAVNDAFENPPTTTEQILHPEKYVEGEGAVEVTIADPVAPLGDGWSVFDKNSMGEFVTNVFLRNGGADDDDAELASEGWGGDAYSVVGNEENTALIWSSSWDSEDDSREFFDVLVETEVNRLDGDLEPLTDDNHVRIDGADYVGEIRLEGDTVTYTLAETAVTLDTLTGSAEVHPVD